MPQYFPGNVPQRGNGGNAAGALDNALYGAAALGELIRSEHGRAGVEKFVRALNPLVPHAFLDRLCMRLQTETPPRVVIAEQEDPPVRPPQKAAPAIPPEQLLSLMQMKQKSSSGGLDPSMLMKLLSQK